MALFFETLRIEYRTIHNLGEHNQRLNQTLLDQFGLHTSIDLADHIPLPADKGLYRCRVTYSQSIKHIELSPYTLSLPQTLRLLYSPITYPYKSVDRQEIANLFARRGDADDILIISPTGQLRDTSIANIALKLDGEWLTPAQPLLPGTMRAQLLKNGTIQTANLSVHDLNHAEAFAVMNALTGFSPLKHWKILPAP